MKKIIILLIVLFSFSGCDLKSYSLPNEPTLEQEKNQTNFEITEDNLVVHFLDVGQADSAFLELPSKETMLIDAGEKNNSPKIIDYIKSLGYSKIDYVIGTHPHADHIGGLADVINAFDIGTIYMPKVTATSKTYENLLNTIKNKNLKIKRGFSGTEVINANNLNAKILAPNSEKYTGYNNYSIVLKLTYQNTSYLFTGDAEELSEKEITENLKSDVLKVGHHGSNTSSSDNFLEKVAPNYAIISVGVDNKYHHPNSETITKLQKYTKNIYRTDLNGDIVVTSDGNTITIKTSK